MENLYEIDDLILFRAYNNMCFICQKIEEVDGNEEFTSTTEEKEFLEGLISKRLPQLKLTGEYDYLEEVGENDEWLHTLLALEVTPESYTEVALLIDNS